MKMLRPAFGSVLLSAACLFFAACSKPGDPRATPVSAGTPAEFTAWKNIISQEIPAAEMDEFDACVNEIRMGIMQRKEASGVDPVAWKLCEYVNGKTFREVLAAGYTATTEWVPRELALQRTNIDKTEAALHGPGSDAKKQELRDYLVIAKDNVAKLEARLAKAKTRLDELKAK